MVVESRWKSMSMLECGKQLQRSSLTTSFLAVRLRLSIESNEQIDF